MSENKLPAEITQPDAVDDAVIINQEDMERNIDALIFGLTKIKESSRDGDFQTAEYLAMETTRMMASTQWALSYMHRKSLAADEG